jgi:hypothetical protein
MLHSGEYFTYLEAIVIEITYGEHLALPKQCTGGTSLGYLLLLYNRRFSASGMS